MKSKLKPKELRKRLRTYYLYRVLSSFSLAGPIFVLFLLSNGLNMTQVMITQSLFTTVILLFNIPGGVFADFFGRKKAIILSTIFHLIAWVAYSIGRTFWQFLIAEFIFGVSAALWIGVGQSFIYDTLREYNKERMFKKIYGFASSIEGISLGLGALAGGYFATFGLRIPIIICTVPVLLSLFVSSKLKETKFRHTEKNYLTHILGAVKFASTNVRVRFFIAYSAIAGGLLFSMGFLYPLYLKLIGLPLIAFGVVYLCMDWGRALGAKVAHGIESLLKEKLTLILIVLIMGVSTLLMSITPILIGILLPIIIGILVGVFDIVLSDYIHAHVESHHRATVMSYNSLISGITTTIAAPVFGFITDVWSLRTTLFLIGLIFILESLVVVLFFSIGRSLYKKRD